MSFKVPEKYRQTNIGIMSSSIADGNNGCLVIPQSSKRAKLVIIASDDAGWEHVSVSTHFRIPTWEEMCFVKDLFWDDEDCVMQLHPKKSEYVNNSPFCLHLWRPINAVIPTPPHEMAGCL